MRWSPAHEAHAIERVSVTFQFKELLQSKPWQGLLSSATLELPRKGFNSTTDDMEISLPQVPGLPIGGAGAVVVGPGGVIVGPGQAGAGLAGRTFRAVIGQAVREEVALHRGSFVYITTVYDGWDIFKERVITLLGALLDQALELSDLGVIKLEYWDRFVFKGTPEEVDYRGLLREGSRHLPPFPFESSELWHSHVGYFAPPGSSAKRLLNLNVDALDLVERPVPASLQAPVPQRSVGIYSMTQDTLGDENSPANASEAVSTLDEMHAILKDALADAITEEAAQRISLNPRTPT